MWKKFAALAAGVVVVAGCVTAPPLVKPEPVSVVPGTPAQGMAGLYVFRDGMATTIDNNIMLNGKCLGQSKKGGYFYVEVPANTDQKLETLGLFNKSVVDLKVEGGKNYFVRHLLQFHPIAPRPGFEVLPEVRARAAIGRLTKLENGVCQ